MPNPGKPVEVKRRLGNPGKRALPGAVGATALASVPAIPRADHELSVKDALERVLDAGTVWLAVTDSPTVCLLRETVEDYAAARALGGDWRQVAALRDQMMKLLSQLGFDPTARSRLGLAEVKAQDVLEGLLARRQTKN